MLPAPLQKGVLVLRCWRHTAKQAEQIRMGQPSGQPGFLSLSLCPHDAATSLKGRVSDLLEGQHGPN